MAVPLLSADDPSECRFCGSSVTTEFRRTFGDNDDVVHRCLICCRYCEQEFERVYDYDQHE